MFDIVLFTFQVVEQKNKGNFYLPYWFKCIYLLSVRQSVVLFYIAIYLLFIQYIFLHSCVWFVILLLFFVFLIFNFT